MLDLSSLQGDEAEAKVVIDSGAALSDCPPPCHNDLPMCTAPGAVSCRAVRAMIKRYGDRTV